MVVSPIGEGGFIVAGGWAGMESPWDLNDEGKVVTSNVNLEGYCPETALFTLLYNCSYLPRKRSGLDKN